MNRMPCAIILMAHYLIVPWHLEGWPLLLYSTASFPIHLHKSNPFRPLHHLAITPFKISTSLKIHAVKISNQATAIPTHSSYPTGINSSRIKSFCDERISNVNVTKSHFSLWHVHSLIKNYLIGSHRR